MTPRVTRVQANNDYSLLLEFTNGEVRLFDVKPFLVRGNFKELSDLSNFKKIKVSDGSVQWFHEQDLSPDTLYILSKAVS